MSREIITQNHQTLVQVLERVSRRTFNPTASNMARRMLQTIQGCTSSKLVGVSYDRGLPFVGYAKDRAFLYDLSRRKMAPIGRFYKLYIDSNVTQSERDAFELQVVNAAEHLGQFCPNQDYNRRDGVVPAGTLARREAAARAQDRSAIRRCDDEGDW